MSLLNVDESWIPSNIEKKNRFYSLNVIVYINKLVWTFCGFSRTERTTLKILKDMHSSGVKPLRKYTSCIMQTAASLMVRPRLV